MNAQTDETRRSPLRALARLRVPLGFLFGAACLVLARPTPRSFVAGAAIALVGEALRVWASGHLEKDREISSSGPYRWTGHPLYLGSSIMGVGLAVAANRWLATAIVAVYLATAFVAAIRTEEAHLASAFGERYAEYRAGRHEHAGRRFSWARVRANREYRALVGLVVVIAVLAIVMARG